MKQKDIAMIIVVVFFSGIISFVVGQMVFSSPKNRSVKAEVVDPVSTQFSRPDGKYFNPNSIDPTQLVHIGDSTNVTPFTGR